MPKKASNTNTATLKDKQAAWQVRYDKEIGQDRTVVNRSGVEVRPLYTPLDWSDGHSTGIYSFDYLRRLCACDSCA